MPSGQSLNRISVLSSLSIGVLLVWLPAVASANTYSGEAAALRANLLGIKTSVSDTGSVAASGGERQSSALTFNLASLVTGEVAHATVFAKGNVSASEASMGPFRVTVGANIIASTFLAAYAHSRCTETGVILNGSPGIIGLTVNGQLIKVSGQINQTISLPDGKIVINEVAKSSNGTSGHISVSALHIIITGIADVALAEANAGISCPSGPEGCGDDDFTTGGGFITGTPSGARASFGVAGGLEENGEFIGHLEYVDHGPHGPDVHGTSVTGYTQVNAATRVIDGTAKVNGQAGFTFHVVVTDHDTSGIDSFSIQLSNGYSAGNLKGGHIEIHGDCDSDDD